MKRNKVIYEKVASELSKQGYVKSWKQCRVKIKNLTQRYRKVMVVLQIVYITSHMVLPHRLKMVTTSVAKGESQCLSTMTILGYRAATEPLTLVDSGNGETCVQVNVDLSHENNLPDDFEEG